MPPFCIMDDADTPFFIQLEGPLFEEVAKARLFDDAKTFVDAIPKSNPHAILKAFLEEKTQPNFCLNTFVNAHFTLPESITTRLDKPGHMDDYIDNVWPLLTKPMQAASEEDTLLSLPYSHLVPGGRFREGFYWDTYFAMLGLKSSKQLLELIENFNYLIELLGFIPNGNRIYFLSRSQPPVFSLMIDRVGKQLTKNMLNRCLLNLEKEHMFWMRGARLSQAKKQATRHTVYVTTPHYAGFLNRYFDPVDRPRAEAFYKESQLGEKYGKKGFYQQLRAVCESGWDFSSRFLDDENNLGSAKALSMAPVDLHCLLFLTEKKLFEFYKPISSKKAAYYAQCMERRKRALDTLFWDKDFFYDYDFEKAQVSSCKSLAALFPLFAKMASQKQAAKVATLVKEQFLQQGGFVTTLKHTTHQWDWPNGWAPLQWVTVVGLMNYGFKELALEGAKRWVSMVRHVYREEKAMLEKYNVVKGSSAVTKGEYTPQEGFGWTNGVTSALEHFLETGNL